MSRLFCFLTFVSLLFSEGCAMFSIRRAVSPLDDVRIVWDGGTERKIKESGTYARIIRCSDGRFWMAFEDLHGNVAVSYSYNCHAWSEDRVVFPRKFESGTLVNAANAEIIALDNGILVCGANYRPVSQGLASYSIAVSRSFDNGFTWEPPRVLYEAGTFFKDGCWEPSFLPTVHCNCISRTNLHTGNRTSRKSLFWSQRIMVAHGPQYRGQSHFGRTIVMVCLWLRYSAMTLFWSSRTIMTVISNHIR